MVMGKLIEINSKGVKKEGWKRCLFETLFSLS